HRAIIDVRSSIDEHRRHARDTTSNVRTVANTGSSGNDSQLAREAESFHGIRVLVEERLTHPIDRHIDHLAHTESEQDSLLYPGIYAPARFRSCIRLGRAHLAAIQRGFESLERAPVLVRVP